VNVDAEGTEATVSVPRTVGDALLNTTESPTRNQCLAAAVAVKVVTEENAAVPTPELAGAVSIAAIAHVPSGLPVAESDSGEGEDSSPKAVSNV